MVETSLEWQDLSLSSEIHQLMCSFVTFIFLYACEPWTLTAELQRRIQVMEVSASTRYYASHTKTMLPMRKSMPRSSRHSEHTKTSWPSYRDANCSGMDLSPVHQVWPKPSCKVHWKGEEDKVDRRKSGKTTSGNGQAWSSPSHWGQWRTGKDGGNWLWNHLWCPNDPRD